MKSFDEYVSIILTSDLTEEEKVTYLKLLNKLRNLLEEDLDSIESKIYILGNNQLSEKEKLIYETNFLYNYYKVNKLDTTDIRKIYYRIDRLGTDEDDIKKIKMLITKLQLKHDLSARFHSSFINLLEEIEKEKTKKRTRTFNK